MKKAFRLLIEFWQAVLMIEIVLLHHHESRQRLSFEKPVDVLHALKATEMLPLLNEKEARVEAENLTDVGYVTYEAASGLDTSLRTRPPSDNALLLISVALLCNAHAVQGPTPAQA